jgi:hypothetical protein
LRSNPYSGRRITLDLVGPLRRSPPLRKKP